MLAQDGPRARRRRRRGGTRRAVSAVPCYADQLRVVYDTLAGDYRDAPGVETRVVSFGTTRGFGSDLPAQKPSLASGTEKVVLVKHSLGGPTVIEFLNRTPLLWRRRVVKHLVMLAGSGGGSVPTLQILAAGVAIRSPPPRDALSFANTTRTFPSVFLRLPSPKVFGRAPLVVTRAKNYSAHDIPEFLAARCP
ncbi:hypothetical protein PR202_ga23572 [Eleusine coracana subsp. coracana]|uniref:Uncharacterized protein n=1 Tax=Eleusine coracana subsp. coracana TaxID=191504 RepID=A0AAV5D5K4_ELECO|nr:hypothetical protein PR202_ga23572 [Eleusine coracana subsp. coracana]